MGVNIESCMFSASVVQFCLILTVLQGFGVAIDSVSWWTLLTMGSLLICQFILILVCTSFCVAHPVSKSVH